MHTIFHTLTHTHIIHTETHKLTRTYTSYIHIYTHATLHTITQLNTQTPHTIKHTERERNEETHDKGKRLWSGRRGARRRPGGGDCLPWRDDGGLASTPGPGSVRRHAENERSVGGCA